MVAPAALPQTIDSILPPLGPLKEAAVEMVNRVYEAENVLRALSKDEQHAGMASALLEVLMRHKAAAYASLRGMSDAARQIQEVAEIVKRGGYA